MPRSNEYRVWTMIDVISIKRLGNYSLEVAFSDGSCGVRDFADVVAREGEMVRPLRDPHYFTRVFIEEGALTWPNGYDVDSIALHEEMKEAGLLRRSDAAE
jgi:Protein of unknown function (DUF2442)